MYRNSSGYTVLLEPESLEPPVSATQGSRIIGGASPTKGGVQPRTTVVQGDEVGSADAYVLRKRIQALGMPPLPPDLGSLQSMEERYKRYIYPSLTPFFLFNTRLIVFLSSIFHP